MLSPESFDFSQNVFANGFALPVSDDDGGEDPFFSASQAALVLPSNEELDDTTAFPSSSIPSSSSIVPDQQQCDAFPFQPAMVALKEPTAIFMEHAVTNTMHEQQHDNNAPLPSVQKRTAHNAFAASAPDSNSEMSDASISSAGRKKDEEESETGGSSMRHSKKKRKTNPSAMSEEERRRLRLERNRTAAQESRDRKKAYIQNLETSNKQLQEKVERLSKENTELRNELKRMRLNSASGRVVPGHGSLDLTHLRTLSSEELTDETSAHNSRTCSPSDTPERVSSSSRSPSPSPFGNSPRRSMFLFAVFFSFAFLFGFMGLNIGNPGTDNRVHVKHAQHATELTSTKISRVLQSVAQDENQLVISESEDSVFEIDDAALDWNQQSDVNDKADSNAFGVTVYRGRNMTETRDSTLLFCPTVMHVAAEGKTEDPHGSAADKALSRLAKKGVYGSTQSRALALVGETMNGLVALGGKPKLTDMFANGVTLLLPKGNFAPEWSSDYSNESESEWVWQSNDDFNMVEISCEIKNVKFLSHA